MTVDVEADGKQKRMHAEIVTDRGKLYQEKPNKHIERLKMYNHQYPHVSAGKTDGNGPTFGNR